MESLCELNKLKDTCNWITLGEKVKFINICARKRNVSMEKKVCLWKCLWKNVSMEISMEKNMISLEVNTCHVFNRGMNHQAYHQECCASILYDNITVENVSVD